MNKYKKPYGMCVWPVSSCNTFVNDFALVADINLLNNFLENDIKEDGFGNSLLKFPDYEKNWKKYRNDFLLNNDSPGNFISKGSDFISTSILSPQPNDITPKNPLMILKFNELLSKCNSNINNDSRFILSSSASIIPPESREFDNDNISLLIQHYISLEAELYFHVQQANEDHSFKNIIEGIWKLNKTKNLLNPTGQIYNAYYVAGISFYGDSRVDAVIGSIFSSKKTKKVVTASSNIFDNSLIGTIPFIVDQREKYFESWLTALKNCYTLDKKEKIERARNVIVAYLGYSSFNKDLEINNNEIKQVNPSFFKKNISECRLETVNKKIRIVNDILKHDRRGIKLLGPLAKPAVNRLVRIANNTNLNNIVMLSGPAGSGKSSAAKEFHVQYMKLIKNSVQRRNDFKTGLIEVIDRLKNIAISHNDTQAIESFLSTQIKPVLFKAKIKLSSIFSSTDDTTNINLDSFSETVATKIMKKITDDKKDDFMWNFFEINCGTLSDDGVGLSNSIKVLFGDQEGPGLFQLTSYLGGTLFLDEIADLPIHLQDMLLKPLEEGTVTRTGWEAYPEYVKNIRVVAATYKDLKGLGREYQDSLKTNTRRGFRPDLYTRLWKNKPVQLCSISDYFLHNGHKKSSYQKEWVKIVAGKKKEAHKINTKKFTETLIKNYEAHKNLSIYLNERLILPETKYDELLIELQEIYQSFASMLEVTSLSDKNTIDSNFRGKGEEIFKDSINREHILWKKLLNVSYDRLKLFLVEVYQTIERLIDEHASVYDSPAMYSSCRQRICAGMTMRFFLQIKAIYDANPSKETKLYLLEEYIPEMFGSLDKKPNG